MIAFTARRTLSLLLFCCLLYYTSCDGMASHFPQRTPLQNLPEVQMQRLISESLKLKDHFKNMGEYIYSWVITRRNNFMSWKNIDQDLYIIWV